MHRGKNDSRWLVSIGVHPARASGRQSRAEIGPSEDALGGTTSSTGPILDAAKKVTPRKWRTYHYCQEPVMQAKKPVPEHVILEARQKLEEERRKLVVQVVKLPNGGTFTKLKPVKIDEIHLPQT